MASSIGSSSEAIGGDDSTVEILSVFAVSCDPLKVFKGGCRDVTTEAGTTSGMFDGITVDEVIVDEAEEVKYVLFLAPPDMDATEEVLNVEAGAVV